jgi:hypothetical protein
MGTLAVEVVAKGKMFLACVGSMIVVAVSWGMVWLEVPKSAL